MTVRDLAAAAVADGRRPNLDRLQKRLLGCCEKHEKKCRGQLACRLWWDKKICGNRAVVNGDCDITDERATHLSRRFTVLRRGWLN